MAQSFETESDFYSLKIAIRKALLISMLENLSLFHTITQITLRLFV